MEGLIQRHNTPIIYDINNTTIFSVCQVFALNRENVNNLVFTVGIRA